MNQNKSEELALRAVNDMGGAFVMALAYIGDRLGLFRAMAGAGPLSSAQLAERTGLNERYVREWARAMVAAEYIDYDPVAENFVMTDEQAFVLADEDSPLFVGGGFHFATPTIWNVPGVMEAFREGGGVSYAELGEEIPEAVERFFRPTYVNFLTQAWLPRVPGLTERLARGIEVADVGCGFGQSTVAMAKAFPASNFLGIDSHPRSIERARRLADEQEADNAEFIWGMAQEVATMGRKYELVCSFDCIRDMSDPLGVLKAIRGAMAADGDYLWSEPNASSNPLENRNPVGKTFSAASPLHCLTVSLAHEGAGLGTVIGESGARRLAREAGFSSFERLPVEHPFVQVFTLRR
ncbi:MAG: methyltransferase domain-containing protein [Acidobacteria bacterium]|nr:methyltransferase domain-containing protein [Acidobacteriota bacterium]